MKIFFVSLIFIALFGFLIWASIEDEKAFSLEMTNLYESCINDNESKWVCESLVASKKAERQAESASSSAMMAAGISAASMGTRY